MATVSAWAERASVRWGRRTRDRVLITIDAALATLVGRFSSPERLNRLRDGYPSGVPSPYVITSPCLDVKDKACVAVCPVQCIYELEQGQLVGRDQDGTSVVNTHPAHPELRFLYEDRMLYINPDECTSCDACLPECPVDAIFPADKVPQDEREFVDVNRFVFADIG